MDEARVSDLITITQRALYPVVQQPVQRSVVRIPWQLSSVFSAEVSAHSKLLSVVSHGKQKWVHALSKSATTPPRSAPPVARDMAKAFLQALEDEYVKGVDGAVGSLLDHMPEDESNELIQFEERVQQAADRQQAISDLELQWGLDDQTSVSYTVEGAEDRISSVAFSTDSKLLVSGSFDNRVRIYRLDESGAASPVYTIGPRSRSKRGFDDFPTVPVRAVAFSPDSNLLVSGAKDSKIRVYALQEGRPDSLITSLGDAKGGINALSFSPDSRFLASGSGDMQLRLYTLTQGGESVEDTKLREIAIFDEATDKVLSVAFSSDSKLLASGSADNNVRIYDLSSQESDGDIVAGRDAAMFAPDIKWTLADAPASVFSVAFSADVNFIASGSKDGKVRVYKFFPKSKPRLRWTLDVSTQSVRSVAFSGDSKFVVAGSNDNMVSVYALQPKGSPVLTRVFKDATKAIWALAISADSALLASGSSDQKVRIMKDWLKPA